MIKDQGFQSGKLEELERGSYDKSAEAEVCLRHTLCADKLKATAGKKLAEAGLSDTYSIGLQLYSKDVFNSTKWKQNLLGKMLMKIREELLI